MARAYSIAEARDRLPSLVHDVEQDGPVSLTRRGKPVAVLLSAGDYERLTRGRPDFLSALVAFRAQHDLEALDLGSAFDGVRDRAPGRDVDWG